MLEVAIVGERDSGRTTFLGLLYATQVRFGSDREDSLRFSATVESLEMITLVYQELMSGAFPDPVTKQAMGDLHFQLGYQRGKPGAGLNPADFRTIHFTLTAVGDGQAARPRPSTWVPDGGTARDVLVVVVDGTKLAARGEETSMLSRLDGAVASIVAGMERPLDRGGRVYPVLVVSKFDRVRPEALRAAKLGAAPPDSRDARRRAAYAEALLGPSLPQTLTILRSREKDRSGFAPPTYVFSWVRTETVPGKPDRVRLRRIDVAGYEPDYASHECLAFLAHLADISARAGH